MLSDTQRLLGYLKPHRGFVLLAVILIITVSILQLIGPVITAYAVDTYLLPADPSAEASPGGFFQLIALYLAVSVATSIIFYWQLILMQSIGQKVMLSLRRTLYHHISRLDRGYFSKQPVGKIMTRITSDVDALNELFTSGFVAFFGDIVLLVGIIVALLVYHYKLALVTFSVLPLLFILSAWFQKNVIQSYRLARKKIGELNGYLQEYLSGITIVQIFKQEERSREAFKTINRDLADANIRSIYYYALFYPGIQLLFSTGLALILWYGGGQVIRNGLTLGILLAFIQYVRRFYEPLNDLAEKFNIFQAAIAAGERIFKVLDTPSAIPPGAGYRPDQIKGEITFDDISFGYTDREWVLADLSVTLKPGQTVAIVGHTGAGKTSFINLLKRYYDPQEGNIFLDDKPLSSLDLQWLRQSIVQVHQEAAVFMGSVLDNIRLFDDSIGEEEIVEQLKELGFKEWFDTLPEGIHTEVGMRGTDLSIGQKQVISIMRAMIHKPAVLILDEATASIDSILEDRIQKAVARLMEGHTTIVIAHRLATIQNADRILVFHRGRLVEDGTHRELEKAGGTYSKLVRLFKTA